MQYILKFIANTFDLNVLGLFLISSIFLIYVDGRDFKKLELYKEYKLSVYAGYLYIAAGIILFIMARYIRL